MEIRLQFKKSVGYTINIVEELSRSLVRYVTKRHSDRRIAIITDTNILSHYDALLEEIEHALKGAKRIVLRPGESSKSRTTKAQVEDELLAAGFGRDSLLISIGGGVISDLAGFVASTYNRGVPIIHVPTSLLAMVDATIGGKTGINTPYGKNLIGSIYQPDAVFVSTAFLTTLPEVEFRSGLAEIVKMALIMDSDLFERIQRDVQKINKRESDTLGHIIHTSIELKRQVVERDPDEQGVRMILNFGHTIGHAIEAASGFFEHHGLAVSRGIAIEARIANLLGMISETDLSVLISLQKGLGLPVCAGYALDRIMSFISSDKKSLGGVAHYVLLDGIGSVKGKGIGGYAHPVEEGIVKEALRWSHDGPGKVPNLQDMTSQ